MARYNTSLTTNSLSGTATISSPLQGAFTELTGTAPYTVTLPNPNLYPGQTQTFYNATSGTITLTTPSGFFSGLGGSGTSNQTIPVNTVVSVISDGTNYVTLSEDGSVLYATDATITGNLTANGGTISISPQSLTINPTGPGAVNNVNIGVSLRGTGAFTTLAANGSTTLTANISSSSTSTGTLVVTGGVGVSGAINSASLSASSITGTIQTAAQPNITSVGSLVSLTTVKTGTSNDTGVAFSARRGDGTGGLFIGPNFAATQYNSLTQNGDTGVITGTQYGSLVIASHDGAGIRISQNELKLTGRNSSGDVIINSTGSLGVGSIAGSILGAGVNKFAVSNGTNSTYNVPNGNDVSIQIGAGTIYNVVASGAYNGTTITNNWSNNSQVTTGLPSWQVDVGGRGSLALDSFSIGRMAGGGTSFTQLFSINNSGSVNMGGLVSGGVSNGSAIFYSAAGNPLTLGNTDSVITAVDRSNADWGITADKTGYDYGIRAIVTNGATYALAVNDGSSYTFRVNGNGDTYIRGNPALTSSNYTSYVARTTSLGTGIPYDSGNRNTKNGGIAHYGSYYTTSTTNSPYYYDYALQVTDGGRGFELSANWIGGNNISIRTLRDCCTNWFGWNELAFVSSSDARRKTNVEEITSERAKEIVLSLRSVAYDVVNEDGTLGDVDIEEPDNRVPRPKEFGYIAQEAKKIIPESVKFNPRLDTPNDVGWANAYHIEYDRLVPVLTKAMKDLYAEIDNLKAEIERLKNGT